VKRSVREAFFDSTWETRKAFRSPTRCMSTTRVLLYSREEENLPFLAYLMKRGLREHPESNDLLMFHIILLRMVFVENSEAAAQEKMLKLSNRPFSFPQSYLLYALDRKSKQMSGGEKTGKGAVSAINLMEFDAGMEKARKGHAAALNGMRQFWRVVKKRSKFSAKSSHQVEDMLMHLSRYDRNKEIALKEYNWLLEKYPTSVALLHSYAGFCDHVLNDYKEAETRRKQALSLENDAAGMGSSKETEEAELENVANRSAATSESESSRNTMRRFLDGMKHTIMGTQVAEVKRLHDRVKIALLVMVALATGGYVFVSLFLFEDVARTNLRGVEVSGLFRAAGITGTFSLRTQHLQALMGEHDKVPKTAAAIQNAYKNVLRQHWNNYDNIPSPTLENFYSSPNIEVSVPLGGGWTTQKFSYWTLVNDFARRMQEASRGTIDSIVSSDYTLLNQPESKRSYIFVLENIFRKILPVFEDVADLYGAEVVAFGKLAAILVLINTCLNAFVVICLSVLVMREIIFNIQNLQYAYVVCCFAISMPRTFSNKIFIFYHEMETRFKAMDDEEVEKSAIEKMPDDLLPAPVSPTHKHQTASGIMEPLYPQPEKETMMSRYDANRYNSQGEDDSTPSNESGNHAAPSDGEEHRFPLQETPHLMPLTLNNVVEFIKRGNDSPGIGIPLDSDKPMHSPMSLIIEDRPRPTMTLTADDAPPASQAHNAGAPGAEQGEEDVEGESLDGVDIVGVNSDFKDGPKVAEVDDTVAATASVLGETTPQPAGEARQEGEEPRSRIETPRSDQKLSLPDDRNSMSNSNSSIDRMHKKASLAKEAALAHIVPAPHLARKRMLENGSVADLRDAIAKANLETHESSQAKQDPTDVAAAARVVGTEKALGMRGPHKSAFKYGCDASGHSIELPPSISHRPVSPVRFKEVELDGVPPQPSAAGRARATGSPVLAASQRSYRSDTNPKPKKQSQDADRSSPINSGKRLESVGSMTMRNSLANMGTGMLRKSASFKQTAAAMRRDSETEIEDLTRAEVQAAQQQQRAMELSEVLKLQVLQHQKWFTRKHIYIGVLFIVLGLSIFTFQYPARKVDELVNIAAAFNLAGRRRYLVRACAFLSRELILDDGTTRMTRNEIVSALKFYLNELIESDSAVRLGGSRGVSVGMDSLSEKHNQIMYTKICPWRTKAEYPSSGLAPDWQNNLPTDCSYPARPGAAEDGLYLLILAFLDAVKNIIQNHGVPDSELSDSFREPRDPNIPMYTNITFYPERMATLKSDSDVAFVLDSFAGDVFQGLHLVVLEINSELMRTINDALYENELLFIVYILAVFVLFYFLLFKRTLIFVHGQVRKAREFVLGLPMYTMSKEEVGDAMSFFEVIAAEDEEDVKGPAALDMSTHSPDTSRRTSEEVRGD